MRTQEHTGNVPIRPAVSVIILRDGAQGPEAFVQHRVTTMDFAAGAVVFPGGRVDPVDYEVAAALPPVGTAVPGGQLRPNRPEAWHLGDIAATPDHAGVLVATALREVQEETGTLLAAECLFPWANWVTPPGPPRRFDTYFFLAAAGADTLLRNTTTEARLSEWLPVRTILQRGSLERSHADALTLMRPTRTLLEELHSLGTTSAAMSAARERAIVPVRNDHPSA